MASNTGENEVGLRKITDMTRLISLLVLVLHFYYFCYGAFQDWHLTFEISDRILEKISNAGLFTTFNKTKLIALSFLVISLVGVKGKKGENFNVRQGLTYILIGLLLYFPSSLVFKVEVSDDLKTMFYMLVSSTGFLLIMSGGSKFSRLIVARLSSDIFNKENETFPQFEQLIENEYSINLPAEYRYKNRKRPSWINIINPFRGLLVSGSPGSGKTYFVFRHIISQHIEKGFSMFVYDFKYNDLTLLAYNAWLENKGNSKTPLEFYTINFDDLSRTHRCNPLDSAGMTDITDAVESARTILMGLNREWIKRQGDFFVESSINFMTAIIWFLRRYQDGEFCTLPHVIELMQTDYDRLFTILRAEKEIDVFINPFVTAYLNDAMQQLEGQVGSTKIALARLASPQLYYVLSGNDFTLDINDPVAPKIVCMGNNPQKIQVFGAVLSLYVTRLVKLVNQSGKLKSSLIFDEFPTIYLNNMDTLIATARSNKVATTIGIQDFSQLKKDYGKEYAEVIMNIAGNIISGQVSGETAKQLSDRFGKIMQARTSLSINRMDTSVSKSLQLDAAIPISTISSLSSGEFVGFVADNPDQQIDLKGFHSKFVTIQVASKRIKRQTELPVIRNITPNIIQQNYLQIKRDVECIVDSEMERIMGSPLLKYLLIKKKTG
ncbi:YWFCY domain-containing protein [Dyadobacter chenwenxiniae]|uniref:YWFCY domain-containing protein n=1 Tax=Dyadobacter chenwenxiniae TaxID=2906456 RepID=A0A9X1TI06_9BACT|nr:conjugal transfer protein MobC [Dyadobacter chenwenxiniae]MCF0065667.1 YWFCY domain-containing protein [Dyadobacter chenwenxiniae]UON85575.1 YWFCY domain-containing protein [Dyadobacter chenwenxiniae]